MNEPLLIRKAALSDLDILTPLFDAYRQFYKQPSDTVAAKSFLRDRITKDESALFIAFLDDSPVGFVQLYPMFSSVSMKRVWVLNDLMVISEARRKGVGKKLLDEAMDFARSTGAKSIVLETASNNRSAQLLYEIAGYHIDDEVLHYQCPCLPEGNVSE